MLTMPKSKLNKCAGQPATDFFNDEEVKRDLKSSAIRSGGISFISKALNTVLLVGGVMTLARLLTPDAYGLVTMAAVFTNFFSTFQELGLTDATIQAPHLKHEEVTSLFWINSGAGVVVMIILIGLSPVASMFYKTAAVGPVIAVSSVGFLFAGLTAQHLALLKRRLLFTRIAVIETSANIIGLIGAVLIAFLGGGYWAIVSRPLIGGFIIFALAWHYCRWRPASPKRGTDVRSLLKIGVHSIGFSVVEYFTTNLDKSFIGKKYGADALGHYSRAHYLATTPSGQFTLSLFHVAVSTLSKLRDDPEKYRRYYLKSVSVISFLGMPMSVFMVVMSHELIYLLLGPQWDRAAGLFSLLGLSAGMKMIYWTQGWIHVSLGRTDRWLRWGLLSAVLTVGGFLLGAQFGVEGVAIAYSSAIIVLTFPGIIYAGRPVGLKFGPVLGAMWRYTFAAILAGLLVHALQGVALLKSTAMLKIFVFLPFYLLAYVAFVIILYWSIRPLIEMIALFREIMGRILPSKKPGGRAHPLTS
jgi:O-antigen/teichoic acid export membrane protein